MKTAVRTGLAAAATAAVLFTAGCGNDAADEPTEETTSAAEETPTETAAPTEIPDVTKLILETAQGNLMRAGLEAEVVGEDGAAVDASDPTQWVVVEQDPAAGAPYEEGVTVSLTVRAR